MHACAAFLPCTSKREGSLFSARVHACRMSTSSIGPYVHYHASIMSRKTAQACVPVVGCGAGIARHIKSRREMQQGDIVGSY